MDTKEMIQEAALELFSKRGFDSSSVRDIAKKTGIKDSSLYYHYKNKQAILDALLDKFVNTSKQMMALVNDVVINITSVDDKEFCAITEQYLQGYFVDDFIRRFIMVMNHERSHNEQLREQYVCWCIKKPVEFQRTVFEKLQDIGYLKRFDAEHMAIQYYAPIFLFYNQYMNDDIDKEVFKETVMTAIVNFLEIYKKGV